MQQLPTRKRNRLAHYDYSQPCAVLLTVCAESRRPLFGQVDAAVVPPMTRLSGLGELVRQAIMEIGIRYPSVLVESYAILPNHIHLLLRLTHVSQDPPTVSRIVKMLKRAVTKQAGQEVWQKGFHDHIIRSEDDFQSAWNYVNYNTAKWVAHGKPTMQNGG